MNDSLYLSLDAGGDKGLERKEMHVQKGTRVYKFPGQKEKLEPKKRRKLRLLEGSGARAESSGFWSQKPSLQAFEPSASWRTSLTWMLPGVVGDGV